MTIRQHNYCALSEFIAEIRASTRLPPTYSSILQRTKLAIRIKEATLNQVSALKSLIRDERLMFEVSPETLDHCSRDVTIPCCRARKLLLLTLRLCWPTSNNEPLAFTDSAWPPFSLAAKLNPFLKGKPKASASLWKLFRNECVHAWKSLV